MYRVIDDLPIDYDFGSKSKNDLRSYGEWFLGHKDDRIHYLAEAVASSPGFAAWQADFIPESLRYLVNGCFKILKPKG